MPTCSFRMHWLTFIIYFVKHVGKSNDTEHRKHLPASAHSLRRANKLIRIRVSTVTGQRWHAALRWHNHTLSARIYLKQQSSKELWSYSEWNRILLLIERIPPAAPPPYIRRRDWRKFRDCPRRERFARLVTSIGNTRSVPKWRIKSPKRESNLVVSLTF
jgi:hypothetical protein